jgi:hypothetical protein
MTMEIESSTLGDFATWVPPTSLMCSLAVTSMQMMCPLRDVDAIEDFLKLPLPYLAKEETAQTDSTPDVTSDEDLPLTHVLSEEDLVDIDPSEGRRRGEQLMSMLNLGPPKSDFGSKSKGSNPRSRLTAKAAPFQPSACVTAPALEESSRSVKGFGSPETHSYLPIISEVAKELFKEDLDCVEGDARDGFVVRVRGEGGNKDPHTVLDSLSASLWPLLGCEVVGFEPHVIPRRTWLTLHCLRQDFQSVCWDFHKTGLCRRGGLCRWSHALPEKYTVDVEIAFF